jgi:hypothetical protein
MDSSRFSERQLFFLSPFVVSSEESGRV